MCVGCGCPLKRTSARRHCPLAFLTQTHASLVYMIGYTCGSFLLKSPALSFELSVTSTRLCALVQDAGAASMLYVVLQEKTTAAAEGCCRCGGIGPGSFALPCCHRCRLPWERFVVLASNRFCQQQSLPEKSIMHKMCALTWSVILYWTHAWLHPLEKVTSLIFKQHSTRSSLQIHKANPGREQVMTIPNSGEAVGGLS